MAPLIDKMAPPQGGPQPQPGAGAQPPASSPAQPPAAAPQQGGGAPEDQAQDAQIDAFLDNAYRLIYTGDQVNPEVLENLRADPAQGPKGVVDALAHTAATIGTHVAESAVNSGKELDGHGVVMPATLSLVDDLSQIAQGEGLAEITEDHIAQATMKAGELLHQGTQQLGIFPDEQSQANFDELMAANQSGELDAAVQEMGGGQQMGGGQPMPGGQMA